MKNRIRTAVAALILLGAPSAPAALEERYEIGGGEAEYVRLGPPGRGIRVLIPKRDPDRSPRFIPRPAPVLLPLSPPPGRPPEKPDRRPGEPPPGPLRCVPKPEPIRFTPHSPLHAPGPDRRDLDPDFPRYRQSRPLGRPPLRPLGRPPLRPLGRPR